MNIDLTVLSIEQLKEVEQGVAVSLRGFNQDLTRAQKRLDSRYSRQQSNAEVLASLKQQLEQAQASLDSLQGFNASAEVVAGAEELLAKRKKEYDVALLGGDITIVDATIEQFELNSHKTELAVRQQQIAEIEAEIDSRE